MNEQGEINGLGPWLWERPWRTLLIGMFGRAAHMADVLPPYDPDPKGFPAGQIAAGREQQD